jgi:site-specific recombinase XerC
MYEGVDRVSKAYQLVNGRRSNPFTPRARSANTWLAHGVAVRGFSAWCAEKGHQALPASIEVVEDWIVDLAMKGRKISTVRNYLGGLCTWHRRHGHELRTKMLLDTLKGIANTNPAKTKSAPLMAPMLHEILDHLDPTNPGDVRSGALLSLMLACALRGREATCLDLGRLGNNRDDDINAGYVVVRHEGLEVVLTRSKTSPSEAVVMPVPASRMRRTVEWVTRWIEIANLTEGQPLFRSLRRGGRVNANRLASAAITPIVRQYVREHLIRGGMTPEKAHVASLAYTSHACRSGFLSTGADAKTPEWLLRERSRHKNANVAAGYIRLRSGWDTDWGFEL